jgi:ABC-type polysaccharide/polyol phosphate export permease
VSESTKINGAALLLQLTQQRLNLAFYLARMEFSRRYSGTMGGALWMFAGPLLTILTIWTALEFGMAASGRFGTAFGANFVVGLSAWLFFADGVQSATVSITSNPHLVKKVVFPVWVLPLASTLAAFAVHVMVFVIALIVLWCVGAQLSINIVTLPFWMAGLIVFVTAVGLLLATLNVRFRDCAVLVPNVVSLLFWVTPIVWPIQQLPNTWKTIALANPVAMIIEGYRASLGIDVSPPTLTSLVLFGLILMGVVALALLTYQRYRRLFADAM